MADIKFMDISENDNPATTDSILVANAENGVKRTTLGAIGNMFAIKGLFHFESVVATIPTGVSQHGPISAPSVEGYTFVFWLSPASSGCVRSTYVELATNPNTNIWIPDDTTVTPASTLSATAVAVYIKSNLA